MRAQQELSGKGQRSTRQRRMILEELAKVTCHPSADEVYEMVRRRLPRVSLGTVYRNLELLSEAGLILKLAPGGSQMRFDADTRPHYHIRCTRCGHVDDLAVSGVSEDDPEMRGAVRSLAKMQRLLAKCSKYDIIGYNLEFAGLCPSCNDRNS